MGVFGTSDQANKPRLIAEGSEAAPRPRRMNATGQTADILEVTAGQAGKWRAASAAVTGSVMVGFMPILTLQLFKAGISAPSMLVWRYGLALVPLAGLDDGGPQLPGGTARRGVADCCGRGN